MKDLINKVKQLQFQFEEALWRYNDTYFPVPSIFESLSVEEEILLDYEPEGKTEEELTEVATRLQECIDDLYQSFP